MMKNDEEQSDTSIYRSEPSAIDFRGKQSVRATFRLSEACINAITILSAQLGIKQKSVFDHLMEDIQTLKRMASELENTDFDRHNRVQKTFVISRRTLYFLDTIAGDYNAPRDALVENSVQRLLPVIAREREKHEMRKELLTEISTHFHSGEKLLAKAEKKLGKEDLIVDKLKAGIAANQYVLNEIVDFIEKSKIIEEFSPDMYSSVD